MEPQCGEHVDEQPRIVGLEAVDTRIDQTPDAVSIGRLVEAGRVHMTTGRMRRRAELRGRPLPGHVHPGGVDRGGGVQGRRISALVRSTTRPCPSVVRSSVTS